MSTTSFLTTAKIAGINLLKLVRYVQESDLLKKVHAYQDWQAEETANEAMVLDFLPSLLAALMSEAQASRISIEEGKEVSEDLSFSYYLIHPAAQFRSILEEARSVIFAGGTMGDVLYWSFTTQKELMLR